MQDGALAELDQKSGGREALEYLGECFLLFFPVAITEVPEELDFLLQRERVVAQEPPE